MHHKSALVLATCLAALPAQAFAQDAITPATATPGTVTQDRTTQTGVAQTGAAQTGAAQDRVSQDRAPQTNAAPAATSQYPAAQYPAAQNSTVQNRTSPTTAAQYPPVQDRDDNRVEAPDGTPAFGFEPYIAIGGGYEVFDRGDELAETGLTDPTEGALINGIVGANIPLGPVFVGAEGFGSYGFGDIDWEYGAAGRFGVRVGDSGLFFGRVGYMWIEGENDEDDDFIDTDGGPSNRDREGMIYGIGVEVGPRDIGLGGITSNSGVRLRLGVDTFGDFESFRPSASVVVHF